MLLELTILLLTKQLLQPVASVMVERPVLTMGCLLLELIVMLGSSVLVALLQLNQLMLLESTDLANKGITAQAAPQHSRLVLLASISMPTTRMLLLTVKSVSLVRNAQLLD